MPAPITTDDLINQVRDQIDESNTVTVSDADILQCLNRGLDNGSQLMARYNVEPFLEKRTLTLSSGVAEYTLPEDLFEDRLLKVEILNSTANTAWEVRRRSFREAFAYRSSGTASVPAIYTIHSRTVTFYPTPSGEFNATIWVMREPETLVQQCGRVTEKTPTTPTTYLDAMVAYSATTAPRGLEVVDSRLNCYVNFIDAQTGEVKSSHQLNAVSPTANTVTIKTTGLTRPTVLGKTLAVAFPSTLAPDDYICNIRGTCVPYYPRTFNNFLVQYAVAELRGRLQSTPELEQKVLDKLEDNLKKSSSGRESGLRIRRTRNLSGSLAFWRNRSGG